MLYANCKCTKSINRTQFAAHHISMIRSDIRMAITSYSIAVSPLVFALRLQYDFRFENAHKRI